MCIFLHAYIDLAEYRLHPLADAARDAGRTLLWVFIPLYRLMLDAGAFFVSRRRLRSRPPRNPGVPSPVGFRFPALSRSLILFKLACVSGVEVGGGREETEREGGGRGGGDSEPWLIRNRSSKPVSQCRAIECAVELSPADTNAKGDAWRQLTRVQLVELLIRRGGGGGGEGRGVLFVLLIGSCLLI